MSTTSPTPSSAHLSGPGRIGADGLPAYARTLPGEPASARQARVLVRLALTVWHLPELADPGTLLVSELVTNSVRHTRCRSLRVTVTRRERETVRITVSDRSRVLPVRRAPDGDAVHGRGLHLVDALASRWGTNPLPWGKRIWADLERGADG